MIRLRLEREPGPGDRLFLGRWGVVTVTNVYRAGQLLDVVADGGRPLAVDRPLAGSWLAVIP